MCVNLLVVVGVKLGLDTFDASMALHGCCSLSSTSHSRSESSASVRDRRPSSPEDLFLPSPRPGQNMCTLLLLGVCNSWTSSHSPADFWLRDMCSDCLPLLHAAQVRAGTLVARSAGLRTASSTVMLHQVARLFVHSSPCTQRWPCTPHLPSSPIEPVVITLGVFDDSVASELSSRLVSSMTRSWTLQASPCGCIRVRLERVSLNCSRPRRDPLPWHFMATSSITHSLVQNLRRSFHSQAPGTSPVLQLGCELLSLCSSAFLAQQSQTHANNNRERPSLQDSASK